MKKYLIKGALALFSGGLLFSCAEKESEYVPLAQQKSKAFEDVFQEIYGDVDPYQDWGFSSGKVVIDPNDSTQVVEVVDLDANISVTRTKAFSRSGARTRGKWTTEPYCDTDGKFWVDNYGYYPPAKITPEEWAAVYEEFSKVHEDRGESVRFTDYFVQQVHSSKDNPLNVYPYFPDQTGAGSTVNAWDHMDQLVCGLKNTHGNNFNGCADPGLIDIWDGVSYGGGDGKQKVVDTDSVQLLLNCDTKRFGYYNSLDSKYHYEYIILEVNGAYYVGFDFCASYSFKTMNDDGTFVKSDYEQDPGESRDPNFNGYQPISNTEIKYNDDGTIKGYEGGDKDVHRDHIYNDWIIKITPALIVEPEPEIDYEYPVYEDVEWEQVERGRVFCEDLGQATREDLDYNDVVFDVIIWANRKASTTTTTTVTTSYKDGVQTGQTSDSQTYGPYYTSWVYFAQVKLLAAGGTIPLTVGGKEVHNAFGVGVTTMVNTRDGNSTTLGSYVAKSPVDIGSTERSFTFDGQNYNLKLFENISKAQDVPIYVNYGDSQVAELEANAAKAPHKLFVPFNTQWTSERKPLDIAYPDFGDYVIDASKNWVNKHNDYYLYSEHHQGLATMPLVMKTKRVSGSETMDILTSTTYSYGSTWNLNDIYLNVNKFWPGDRLRFYGSGINENSYITVVFADGSKPYFIDMKFTEPNTDGSYPSTTFVEVLLDETYCEKLNNSKKDGKIMLQVQGRSFTLDKIARVPF